MRTNSLDGHTSARPLVLPDELLIRILADIVALSWVLGPETFAKVGYRGKVQLERRCADLRSKNPC